MSARNTEELGQMVNRYLDRLSQVDRLLADPTRSLIGITVANLTLVTHPFANLTHRPLYFPEWIADDRVPETQKTVNLTTALAAKTVQRLWKLRRRFPQLESSFRSLEDAVKNNSPGSLVEELLADSYIPPRAVNYKDFVCHIKLFDNWCPYSTSQILWVLIGGGESRAYTGVGVLAFFAMLWRMHGTEGGEGAGIGVSPATGYVTSSCWGVIHALVRSCERRSLVIDRVAATINKINKLVSGTNATALQRNFPLLLDRLAALLQEYAMIALQRKAFTECAKEIERLAEGLTQSTHIPDAWIAACSEISESLKNAGHEGDDVVKDARRAFSEVVDPICQALDPALPVAERRSRFETLVPDLGMKNFPIPRFTSDRPKDRYWNKLASAAAIAREACTAAVQAFHESVKACSSTTPDAASILITLAKLSEANESVASNIKASIEQAENWCALTVVPRELANASEDDWTSFDPAELVSAAEVGVKSGQIQGRVAVEMIATKAMAASKKDGSWISGQPFYLDPSYSEGAWAPTSDIVWTLARILTEYPSITSVDDHLENFLDWLEMKATRVTLNELNSASISAIEVTGWVSERQIRPDRIDLWATAFAINSLLEIRSLFEARLWELCKERFSTEHTALDLDDIKPVDMGASHSRRIHFRLARMARATQGSDYPNAEYSLVLHGPPGSSKTVVANALAKIMWRGARKGSGLRLIRVTPADFTRLGEDRIDFEAREIFKLLMNVRGVTILFDEIDDLLRKRDSDGPPTFLKLIVPAMLNRLQDLRDRCPQQEISFIIATNYIDNIEPALIRKGRIDWVLPLVYPDRDSRAWLIDEKLQKLESWSKPFVEAALLNTNIEVTDCWPFKTVMSLCSEISRDVRNITDEIKTDPVRLEALLEAVTRAIATHKASLVEPYEHTRLKRTVSSGALRDEVLHYLIARSGDVATYQAAVKAYFKDVDLTTAQLAEVLGRAVTIWNERSA